MLAAAYSVWEPFLSSREKSFSKELFLKIIIAFGFQPLVNTATLRFSNLLSTLVEDEKICLWPRVQFYS